jgi:hypothetical protein
MSQFDFERSKTTLSYVKRTLESGTNPLETLGQLKVGAKEIRGPAHIPARKGVIFMTIP